MSSNNQMQLLQNPPFSTQTSQSFSCSTVTPPPLQLITNPLSTVEHIKPLLPSSSSSSTVPEPVENTHTIISPLQTNEANQSTVPSDTNSPPPVN
jgi:hypothetical protein